MNEIQLVNLSLAVTELKRVDQSEIDHAFVKGKGSKCFFPLRATVYKHTEQREYAAPRKEPH